MSSSPLISSVTLTGQPRPVVHVTKRVTFNAAHFYWLNEWSEAENQQTFYACSNRLGHGHNYTVELTVASPINPSTGMVVNLKDLKQLLQETVIEVMDHKNLNHQVPFFAAHIPTLENITRFIAQQVALPLAEKKLTLTRLRVVENETLYATLLPDEDESFAMQTTLTRCYDFAASHRLHNPDLTPAENDAIYSICNNPNGHGHNYELEVTLLGTPDSKTGMLANIVTLDQIVQETLLSHVDHKHLNLDVGFLTGINPTAENVVVTFWQQLHPRLQTLLPFQTRLYKLRLLESRNNFSEYYGG